MNSPWKSLDLIAFDTETSGKYPLQAEVCELAAVKWRGGRVVDTFSTLIKPSQLMDAEVIAIHGITNDMVENAPKMSEKIKGFHDFIQGGIMVAHHAPFDLGFMSLAMEEAGLELPTLPALCTSLLARKLFPESENHRLQTLIGFFNLPRGAAHRALDDAQACLEVALRCLDKVGAEATLDQVIAAQAAELSWQRFSLRGLTESSEKMLVQAIREGRKVDASYAGGSKPGEIRRLHPLGVVRSLDGDFVVAYDEKDQRSKRYLLEKIKDVTIV